MSAPTLARGDAEGRRFYVWREGTPFEERFWSVTTLLGMGVPKQHMLVPWAVKATAELAYDDVAKRGKRALRWWAKLGRAHVIERKALGELKSVKLEKLTDRDLALRWVKGEPNRIRDAAGARGTEVHDESEDFVLRHLYDAATLYRGGDETFRDPGALAHDPAIYGLSPEALPYFVGFLNWLEDFRPIFLATEATVFSRRERFAGTLDAVVVIRLRGGAGRVLIVDYKTSSGIRPEVAPQLSAYSNGDFVASPDGVTELPLPAADGGAVLHLGPQYPRGYSFREVEIGPDVYRAFLYLREAARWGMETSREVIGSEIEPEGVAS